MNSIRVLVICSNELQDEILKAGKGFSSAREFYKRNHVWTEGLISAARAVGAAAKYLVYVIFLLPFGYFSFFRNSADSLIMGKGKFEQVIVAAQEIGARFLFCHYYYSL
jgi:huntingtin interacting protein 1